MARTRIQIKKIENIATRQVTFSKRRKGLIKKAQELSTLCDAEIALIVFASSGKLYEFSTSSSRVTQVIRKYVRHTRCLPQELETSMFEPNHVSEEDCAVLRKRVEKQKQELSQLEGKDLEGLDLEELCKIERQIEKGFTRVGRMKDEKLHKVITELKRKENTLVENNRSLELKISNAVEGKVHNAVRQSVQSPENIQILNHVSFDTSLRLGLV